MLEHLEPTAGTIAVAVASVFRLGKLALEPLSLTTSLAPSFHWYLTLKCDLPPIVCRLLVDGQLAEDHRLHRRHAAAAVGDLSSSCRRERAAVTFWTWTSGAVAAGD